MNVPVGRTQDVENASELWRAVMEVEATLGDNGRVLVRPSGTEPLIRIMVEAATETDAQRYADVLAHAARQSFKEQVG